jgi:iron complex transport system permease protein
MTRKWIFSLVLAAVMIIGALCLGASSDLDLLSVWEFRAPRVFLAFSVGAALALSGLILQVIFANPMCEPYTLGISSGASLGALLFPAVSYGVLSVGVQAGALIGALFFTFVLLFFDSRGFKRNTLLLMGVMFNFLGSSLVSIVIAVRESGGVQNVLLWLLGDLSRAEWVGVVVLFILVMISFGFLQMVSSQMDALMLGEEAAIALGVDAIRLRKWLLTFASLLISFSVSQVGMIGFVGLLIPHLSRTLWSAKHRWIILSCVLWGGSFLVFGDLLSRIVIKPYELPAGVMTAIVGAPFYLILLSKKDGERV